jgi:hypothetical protein
MSSASIPTESPSRTGSTTVRLEAALVLQIARRNGPTFLLAATGGNTIGRSADGDIVIPDRLASREHAVIERDCGDGRWQIRDLGSRNGTWVDGRRVDEATLEPGMAVRIGTTELIFRTFSRRSTALSGNHAEQLVRCGPIAEFEGDALQRARAGSNDDNRRTMLLYQISIHLLSSRSLNDIMTAAVELAAEHTAADAVGWFTVKDAAPLEPVLVVPPNSKLAERIAGSDCHRLSGDGQAVWITHKAGDQAEAEGGYDLTCIPVLETDRPRAVICETAGSGSLRESDFDFLVALASLTAAACAGQEQQPLAAEPAEPVSLAAIETVKASPEDFRSMAEAAGAIPDPLRTSEQLGDSLLLDDWQRLLVEEALRRSDGRVPEAAEALGISRATLYRKLEQYGLSREAFSQAAEGDSPPPDSAADSPAEAGESGNP